MTPRITHNRKSGKFIVNTTSRKVTQGVPVQSEVFVGGGVTSDYSGKSPELANNPDAQMTVDPVEQFSMPHSSNYFFHSMISNSKSNQARSSNKAPVPSHPISGLTLSQLKDFERGFKKSDALPVNENHQKKFLG